MRTIFFHVAASTRPPPSEMPTPVLRRTSIHSPTDNITAREKIVAMAAPRTPNRGNGPSPYISTGSSTSAMSTAAMLSRMVDCVSPAPLNVEVTLANAKSSGSP